MTSERAKRQTLIRCVTVTNYPTRIGWKGNTKSTIIVEQWGKKKLTFHTLYGNIFRQIVYHHFYFTPSTSCLFHLSVSGWRYTIHIYMRSAVTLTQYSYEIYLSISFKWIFITYQFSVFRWSETHPHPVTNNTELYSRGAYKRKKLNNLCVHLECLCI